MSVLQSVAAGRGRERFDAARRAILGGAMVLALTLTAACGGGTGSSSAGSSGSGGTNASGVTKEMQALIDQYSKKPTFTAPGPALDASQLKGKTIALLPIDLRVPALSEVVNSVKGIAQQIGMRTTVFDGQSNPTLVTQGFTQALTSHVDAIIMMVPPQLVASQIAAAQQAGVPVVEVVNSPPKKGVPGQGSDPHAFGVVAPDSALVGQLLAATAIVQTHGKGHVAIMNTSEVSASPMEVSAMEDTLKKCSGCDYTKTDTALADWSTELPNQAASVVRSNPNLNFILTLYDNMAIFATAGVRQAGATGRVHMASFNGTSAALDLVKSGDIMVADPAQNNDWAAWAAMDQVMRGMLKMDPADPVLPIRYVNTADLKNVDTSSQQSVNEALFGHAYRDGYLKLWGLN